MYAGLGGLGCAGGLAGQSGSSSPQVHIIVRVFIEEILFVTYFQALVADQVHSQDTFDTSFAR